MLVQYRPIFRITEFSLPALLKQPFNRERKTSTNSRNEFRLVFETRFRFARRYIWH